MESDMAVSSRVKHSTNAKAPSAEANLPIAVDGHGEAEDEWDLAASGEGLDGGVCSSGAVTVLCLWQSSKILLGASSAVPTASLHCQQRGLQPPPAAGVWLTAGPQCSPPCWHHSTALCPWCCIVLCGSARPPARCFGAQSTGVG